MNTAHRAFAATSLACLLLAGCHVSTNTNGDKKNVDIGTPFGSMKVNTDKSSDTTAIGLTAYPGATPVKEDKDSEGNNADVNLSFGDFHLGVKAATFQTSDSTDKVLAFYKKDLAKRYGDVIECRDNTAVGTPTSTSQGLSCDKKQQNHISNSNSDLELRSGSPSHQHIVGVEEKNGGTKIGLVLLDLPSHLSNHDNKDSE
jgi:hypothetical protein